ncbi:unnamed protein product [Vitrella brassicaformis CCMP3155]|uniref:Uncharacterized protein n=1 Tax=Vitrella brassicaformis (strain CCMP3155) TaxID=1169540 RepID=A0A0G4H5X2_VITBC|nr:unnamed protein product [Vitrella brassicaformis CCMP3155]|eukprot:CEM39080.1 unnamed protein product [Vitrella brassicaformis CCMP3155]
MVVDVPPSPSSIIASPPEQPHMGSSELGFTFALLLECLQACPTQWHQGQSVQAIRRQGEVIKVMAGRASCYRGEVASQQQTRIQHRDEVV